MTSIDPQADRFKKVLLDTFGERASEFNDGLLNTLREFFSEAYDLGRTESDDHQDAWNQGFSKGREIAQAEYEEKLKAQEHNWAMQETIRQLKAQVQQQQEEEIQRQTMIEIDSISKAKTHEELKAALYGEEHYRRKVKKKMPKWKR